MHGAASQDHHAGDGVKRRAFLGALLALPFAKPALKAIMVPVTAVTSRFAKYRVLKAQKERALWTAMWDHMEQELWEPPV